MPSIKVEYQQFLYLKNTLIRLYFLDSFRTLLKQYFTGVGRRDGPEAKLAASLEQIKFFYRCEPGDITPVKSKLSQFVFEDIEKQFDENGFI